MFVVVGNNLEKLLAGFTDLKKAYEKNYRERILKSSDPLWCEKDSWMVLRTFVMEVGLVWEWIVVVWNEYESASELWNVVMVI